MSQNRSDRHIPPTSKARAPRPAGSQATPQSGEFPFTAPIDENADRLMDQVFSDIEQMLDRGAQLHLEPADVPPPPAGSNVLEFPQAPTPQYTDSPVTSSSLALLPKLSPRQLTREEEPTADEDETDLILELAQEEKPPSEQAQSSGQWLVLITFAALLITSGIWVFVRYYLPKAGSTANVPSAAEILQAKQDTEFLTYVQRSMERIESASQSSATSTASETGSTPSALPPLYVPLPPPPSVAAVTPTTVPSPSARISVAPLPPVSIAPSVPAAPAAPAAAPAPAPAVVVPNIAPSPTHVLIGLLELGDRSAALFELDGTPQRVQVGEAVGSSGWFLVSISGEEAIVRRNGEVRSVFIGQKF